MKRRLMNVRRASWRLGLLTWIPLVVGFMFALMLGGTARAQQDVIIAVPHDVPNLAGVAIGFAPDYEGSDDVTFGVLPAGQLTFGNRYVRLIGTSLSANLIDHEYLRLGPSLNYRFGRKNVYDEVVKRMADVDGSVELGAFAGIEMSNAVNLRYRFTTTVEFLHDVSGGHDGWVTDISAQYWRPLSKPLDVGVGVGLTFAGEDYMKSFFSVDSSDSAASGLPRFDAESGLKEFRIQPMFVFHFSRQWHLGLGLRYKILLGDAADSPVVDIRGSSNQILAGIGLIYSW